MGKKEAQPTTYDQEKIYRTYTHTTKGWLEELLILENNRIRKITVGSDPRSVTFVQGTSPEDTRVSWTLGENITKKWLELNIIDTAEVTALWGVGPEEAKKITQEVIFTISPVARAMKENLELLAKKLFPDLNPKELEGPTMVDCTNGPIDQSKGVAILIKNEKDPTLLLAKYSLPYWRSQGSEIGITLVELAQDDIPWFSKEIQPFAAVGKTIGNDAFLEPYDRIRVTIGSHTTPRIKTIATGLEAYKRLSTFSDYLAKLTEETAKTITPKQPPNIFF